MIDGVGSNAKYARGVVVLGKGGGQHVKAMRQSCYSPLPSCQLRQ